MRYILISLVFFVLILLPESRVLAHGGGLNAEGCHNDRTRGTYHCHRGNSKPAPRKRVQSVYAASSSIYANCAEVINAGAAPLYRGERGYSAKLGRDGDGVACESGSSGGSQRNSSPTTTSPSHPVLVAALPATVQSVLTPPIEGTAQVLDGDTIQIGTTRIRFYGIDAFEGEQRCTSASGQSYGCGGVATRALTEQIEDKLISCVPKGIDAYNRQLAVCRAEAIDLSAWMVRQGHALAYIKYSLDYEADEAFAKENLNGAHSGSFEKPWEYRLTRGAAGAEAIRRSTPPSPNCTIKGNVRSDGTRIYHMPSDPSYSRVKPENWFCDVDEAVRAGFRPAYKPN